MERMLRIHFLQRWYALSDPAVEEALYDLAAMRPFAGIDWGHEAAPDETTVRKFQHLLERRGLTAKLFATVSKYLKDKGMKASRATMVDAMIIAAAPSTKNRDKARDPEMHQATKGNQWHFGMETHNGADETTGFVHAVTATAANVADVTKGGNWCTARNALCMATPATPAPGTTRNSSMVARGLSQPGAATPKPPKAKQRWQ